MMKFSFLSTILLFIVFVATTTHLTVVVDGRRLGEEENININNINNNNNNNVIIYDVLLPVLVEDNDQDQDEDQDDRRSLWNVIDNLKYEIKQLIIETNTNANQNHRSLGGGILTQQQQQQLPQIAEHSRQRRSLYQDWARDDNEMIHWWIWLIIALSITGCCCLTCCFSVCCLRD